MPTAWHKAGLSSAASALLIWLVVAPVISAPGAALASPVTPLAPAEAIAQQQSARLRIGDLTIQVLGVSWDESVVPGKFDFRDPTRDRSLRAVTLAVSERDRSAFMIPELGKRVEIEFLEGDPDRPIVLGLLFPKVDEVAPGGDSDGKGWVKIRLTFVAVSRSKGAAIPGQRPATSVTTLSSCRVEKRHVHNCPLAKIPARASNPESSARYYEIQITVANANRLIRNIKSDDTAPLDRRDLIASRNAVVIPISPKSEPGPNRIESIDASVAITAEACVVVESQHFEAIGRAHRIATGIRAR